MPNRMTLTARIPTAPVNGSDGEFVVVLGYGKCTVAGCGCKSYRENTQDRPYCVCQHVPADHE
jgi:hypothetical protein